MKIEQMREIIGELKRVQRLPSLRKNTEQGKIDREWWILAHAVGCMYKSDHARPMYALHQDPPAPDFITYNENREEFASIEVTEVLRHDRRRGDEKRGSESEASVIEPASSDPWESFNRILDKKSRKNYPNDTWLLVYHNMWTFDFDDWPTWPDHLFAKVESDREIKNKPRYVTDLRFSRIIVLNSRGDSLVQIHPYCLVVHVEPN